MALVAADLDGGCYDNPPSIGALEVP